MKTSRLKKLLKIDLIIQFTLIASSLLLFSFTFEYLAAFSLFYFCLGSWQLLSFFVNFNRRKNKIVLVQSYKKAVIILFFIGLIFFILTLIAFPFSILLLIYLFIMLFVGIIMAITYIDITLKDINQLKRL